MRIPPVLIPVMVVAALTGGYFMKDAFTQPSTSLTTDVIGTAAVECVVDGVKCKGTASLFTSHMKDCKGIGAILTYAADHRAVITYDPTILTPDAIKQKIDSPVALDESTSVAFFKCVSMSETTLPTESTGQ